MIELGIDIFGNLRIDEISGYRQTPRQRLAEIVEEVQLMDEVGVDFFAVGEHHRDDYAVAAPEILLAAVSTVTKNIKLSSAVSVVSSTDPVKLYQDFATVDLLSNGRAEIMAGRGSFIESYPLFGYDLKDYDELFDEKIRLLVELNEKETISWEGKYRPKLVNQTIYPRPELKLPIWIAVGGTPESVVRAAELGSPVMFAIIGGSWRNFKPLIDYYKEAWLHFGHNPADFQAGVHLHSLFGDDVVEDYYPMYAEQMNRVGKTRNWPPYQREAFDFGRTKEGHLVVGNAQESAEKIIAVSEGLGLTRFSAHLDTGSPTHQQMMKAIELYGKEIIPAVKKHFAK